MANFQTETFGGSGVKSVSRGYRRALPSGHERSPRAARRTSQPNGRGAAYIFGRDHAYVFQSRGGTGTGHLIYQLRHITTYDYEDPVSVSHHVLRLTPRNLTRQRCSRSQIAIAPAPPSSSRRIDYFGNVLTFFTLREPHGRLTVDATSELEVQT